MRALFTAADRLLRGQLTQRQELEQGRIAASSGLLMTVGAAMGAIYGLAMGLFGALRPEHATWKQVAADVIKVPLLFLLTIAVALPSLYAFSALADSKLRFVETLKLALIGVAINLILLASLAPVTAFFTVSTTSYSFMVLLNVAFFCACGAIGLGVLYKALNAVYVAPDPPQTLAAPPPASETERMQAWYVERERWIRSRREAARPRRIFVAWFAIYGFVGAQMAWILRPFIGSPTLEFQLFRPRSGNFLEGIFTALFHFLTGK